MTDATTTAPAAAAPAKPAGPTKGQEKTKRKLTRHVARQQRIARKHNLLRRISFMHDDNEEDDYDIAYYHEGGPDPLNEGQELPVGLQKVKASQIAQFATALGEDSENPASAAALIDLTEKFGRDIMAVSIKSARLEEKQAEREATANAKLALEEYEAEQQVNVDVYDNMIKKAKAAGLKEVDEAHSLEADLHAKRIKSLKGHAKRTAGAKASLRRVFKKRWLAGDGDRRTVRELNVTLMREAVGASAAGPAQGRGAATLDAATVEQQIIQNITAEGAAHAAHREGLTELTGLSPRDRAARLEELGAGSDDDQRLAAVYGQVQGAALQRVDQSRSAPQGYVTAMEGMTTETMMALSQRRFQASLGGDPVREAELRAELKRAELTQRHNRRRHAADYDAIRPDKKVEEKIIGREAWHDNWAFALDFAFGGGTKPIAKAEAMKLRADEAKQNTYQVPTTSPQSFTSEATVLDTARKVLARRTAAAPTPPR